MRYTKRLYPAKMTVLAIIISITQTSFAVSAVAPKQPKPVEGKTLQAQREQFHDIMNRYTTVETLPPDKDYFLQKLLKSANVAALLKTVDVTLDDKALSEIGKVIEQLHIHRKDLESAMKTSVCNRFIERSLEQIDAIEVAKTVEAFEQQLATAQQKALREIKHVFSPFQLSQLPNQQHSVTKRIKTDYLAMAYDEPEFFKQFTHERCLLQSARNLQPLTPKSKSTENNATSQSITIDFVRD